MTFYFKQTILIIKGRRDTLKRLKISLKAARVNANLSQEEVARKMKKSKVTINNWENGKTEIDYGNLNELCRLYSVTMDDILLPY